MYVIRGLKGEMMFDTKQGKETEEAKFETYSGAAKTLDNLECSLPIGYFKIVATDCDRCNSDNDVAIIHVDDEPKVFCQKVSG